MNLQNRLWLSIFIGLISFSICFASLARRECDGCDFNVSWRAAWLLAEGKNPYFEIQPVGAFPYNTTFFYPLPAALVALPFSLLPPNLAGAAFFGISAALLAFAVTQDGFQRLPLFLSAPFFIAAALAQWAPLVIAAALLPPLQWLAIAKPNIGLAALVYRPTWLGWGLSAAFGLLSLVILPGWIWDWRDSLPSAGHPPPFLVFPLAFVLLLAGLRWKSPEGRLLLALSIVPQTIWFYDQLLLWLVPRSLRASLALAVLSWIAYGIWRLATTGIPLGDPAGRPDAYVVALLYLPTLGILFFQDKLFGGKNAVRQPE